MLPTDRGDASWREWLVARKSVVRRAAPTTMMVVQGGRAGGRGGERLRCERGGGRR